MLPGMESLACEGFAVPMDVMRHVINVESSRNPYAIGVVGGALARQPRQLDEALATLAAPDASPGTAVEHEPIRTDRTDSPSRNDTAFVF